MEISGILLLASLISNLLQGFDAAGVGGSAYYVVKEFDLDGRLFLGCCLLLIAIGFLTTKLCWGRFSDWLGRRPLLIVASLVYLLDSLLMLWSRNMYMVLLARFLYGFELGFSFTLLSTYFHETAPLEYVYFVLPFVANLVGIWISCAMVYGFILMRSENWRLMFMAPLLWSIAFFLLIVVYLPETPRWLVSTGRRDEARRVLQRLRGTEDVSYELELLVLSVGPIGVDIPPPVVEEEEEEVTDDNDDDKSDDEQASGTSPPQQSHPVDCEGGGEGQTTIIISIGSELNGVISNQNDITDDTPVTTIPAPGSEHGNTLPKQSEVFPAEADAPNLISIIVDK